MNSKKRTILFIGVASMFAGAAVVGTVQASAAGGTGGGANRITSSTVFAKAKTNLPVTIGVSQKDDGVVANAESSDSQTKDGFASGATASQ